MQLFPQTSIISAFLSTCLFVAKFAWGNGLITVKKIEMVCLTNSPDKSQRVLFWCFH